MTTDQQRERVIEALNELGTVTYYDVLKFTFEKYGQAVPIAAVYKIFKAMIASGDLKKSNDHYHFPRYRKQ